MQFSENVRLAKAPKRESNLDQPFPVKWDKHITSFRKDDFWDAVRACVASITIPKGLELHYADASLTIHTKNKRVTVKVTTAGEVHVEKRLSKLEFKSQKFYSETITEAVEQFLTCLTQQFQISRLS
jgi:hypothetical protein